MSEHLLLVRHATAWASQKQRALDPELLETALDLRAFHDEVPATRWPPGSIEHLMLRRWPAHGPEAPDIAALADTLGTFVQFLRATGRMASGSGDPKALAKEAQRAAPKMTEACADRDRHSQGKVLTDFGRELGIDLDGASSMEDMQEQLNRLMGEWNSLPEEERIRRMPLTSTEPGVHSRSVRLDGLDGVDDAPVLQGDPVRSAQQARSSSFVQTCLRLADWLAPSRKVTEIGVLRLAPAAEAYRRLELWRWQDGADAVERGETIAGPSAPASEEEAFPWKSAADAEAFPWKSAADAAPLHRVWYSSQSGGLIDVLATVAKPTGRLPRGDDDWIGLACAAFLGLWESADDFSVSRAPLLALLGTGLVGDGIVSRSELAEVAGSHPASLWNTMPTGKELTSAQARAASERHLDGSLHWFADTGIWTRDGDDYLLTDLGRDFGALVFKLIDDGELDL
jgi:hypothetical protein